MPDIIIKIELSGEAFIDRTAEELQFVLSQITESDCGNWSLLADGERLDLFDSHGELTGTAEVFPTIGD